MFGYGYKQSIQRINEFERDYKRVELTQVKDPSILYFLFWANIPPKEVQEYGTQFSSDIVKNKLLDKYKASDLPTHSSLENLLKAMRADTIYLVTQDELPVDLRKKQNVPKGIKLIDVFNYPNGEANFYIIAKEKTN